MPDLQAAVEDWIFSLARQRGPRTVDAHAATNRVGPGRHRAKGHHPMRRTRAVENRGPCDGGGPFAGLAKQTGFSEAFLADLAARGELRSVIEGLTETRAARPSGASTPLERLDHLHRKRWPEPPKDSRMALMEMLAKRWPDWRFDK